MKFISLYRDFILEQTSNEVDPMVASRSFNKKDLQDKIKEYQNQITKVRTVFSNDKLSDVDIPNQLKDFLKDKDTKKFVFDNELTQLEVDVCNISRQLRKKELELNKLKQDVKTQRTNISPLEPQSKENSEENITKIQTDQSNIQKELQRLRELLLKKEKNKNDVVRDYEEKLKNIEKEIRSDNL